MTEDTSQIIPIVSPWDTFLWEAVQKTRHDLFIIGPYLKKEVIITLQKVLLSRPDTHAPLSVRVITRLLAEEFLSGSSDIAALHHLLNLSIELQQCAVEIRAINNVHAKVWLFDDALAIVGSGNATPSGLTSNLEYGLAVSAPQTVAHILQDWNSWWMQADPITTFQLAQMRFWLEQATPLLQTIEVQAQEQRRILAGQIGRPPRLGKRLALHPATKKFSPSNMPRIAETPQLYESIPTPPTQPIRSEHPSLDLSLILDCAQCIQALSWVFPSAPNINRTFAPQENFLKLACSGASARSLLYFLWADGKRLSQSTLSVQDQPLLTPWSMTLNVTQVQRLQTILLESSQQGKEKIQLHFSLTSDGRCSLTLATPTSTHQEIVGTHSSLSTPFPFLKDGLSVVIEHRHLADLLHQIALTSPTPPHLIQLHLVLHQTPPQLEFITGPLDSPLNITIPAIQQKLRPVPAGPSILFSLDYKSLQDCIFSSQDRIPTWKLLIDPIAEYIQLTPASGDPLMQDWRHQLWHKQSYV